MTHSIHFLILLSFITLLSPVFAKRLAPATIEPLISKQGTIQPHFERNSQGFAVYLISKDKAGDLRWKTKLFSELYEKNLETDVQDIHLKQLFIKDAYVIVVDEHGRNYKIDIIDGTIQKSVKP